ncbi:AAA family ATPase [Winogradskyella poriferorum]|uniref:AAA family ATPase n=1 Tax=Winogradskyella poriferorum TaxID=307627 RepID=A0ABU7W1J4_9FLAO
MEKRKNKGYISFKQMMDEYEKRPKVNFLWNGVKEKSFGLVFGPSKSGKTIFCENLAMSIAIGRKEFFGYKLSGEPKKVLFIGLEEFWENRIERNSKQYGFLSQNEKEILNHNYLYQAIDYSRYIHDVSEWNELKNTISESQAQIVFIDSITRMNHGILEDSKTAEQIMQRLRGICHDLGITLICVHHTPKMYDKPLLMDSIKGSSVFAQESDFAIGINQTSKGYRYLKNIFFRYSACDDEVVKEFSIDENVWLNYFDDSDEDSIIARSDRRRKTHNRDQIVEFINENSSLTHKTKDLVDYFTNNMDIQERQVKAYLKKLSQENIILNPKHGFYGAVKKNMSD